MRINICLKIIFLFLCTLIFLSCATKPKGLIDFSNVPDSKYRVEEKTERAIQKQETSVSDMVVDTSIRERNDEVKTPSIIESESNSSITVKSNEQEIENNSSLTSYLTDDTNNANITDSDLLRDFGINSSTPKTEAQNIDTPNTNKENAADTEPDIKGISEPKIEDTSTLSKGQDTILLDTTNEISQPVKVTHTGFKEATILFLPLKDTSISISLLSSRIRSMFAYEMPDTIVFTGVQENQKVELTSLFGEYKAYNNTDATILIKNATGDTPLLAENTHIITYTTKDKYNEDELSGINFDTKPSNNYDALYRALNTYKNTPVVLLLSPNERSYEDFSSWTSPSRSEAQNKWTLISTISDLGYYDVIENGRWNSSSSGTSYTDWTYKSDNSEMRLDFMMLKDVAVEDAYTIDIADYSTASPIKRRGILAHLVLENEQ